VSERGNEEELFWVDGYVRAGDEAIASSLTLQRSRENRLLAWDSDSVFPFIKKAEYRILCFCYHVCTCVSHHDTWMRGTLRLALKQKCRRNFRKHYVQELLDTVQLRYPVFICPVWKPSYVTD
jgi:hypothetical protein